MFSLLSSSQQLCSLLITPKSNQYTLFGAGNESGVSVAEKARLAAAKAKRFTPRGDKLLDLAAASVPLVLRLGSGALVAG